jgi:hypothetical protein
LQLCLLYFECPDGGIGTAVDLDDGDAQIGLGLAHDFDLVMQMLELEFLFIEQPSLLDEAVF